MKENDATPPSTETRSSWIESRQRRRLLSAIGAGIIAQAAISPTKAQKIQNPSETDASLETGTVSQIPADPEKGFNYPYFIYVPSDPDPSKPLVVEPVNTGTSTDSFEEHRAAADRAIRRGTGRRIARELSTPYFVPVFPRPRTDPVDGTHYVHSLDDDTMRIDSGPLERVDLQLLAMADDARERLRAGGHSVSEGLILNGFSASGNFVDRFAALHPDEVISVSAGGLNGTVILPRDRANGHRLRYPIGVDDVEDLTGQPFDLDAFRSVNRFYFYGDRDWLDTIMYRDAWTSRELRDTALDVYGRNIHTERYPYSKAVHDALETNAVFRRYEGIGHTDQGLGPDIVAFHRRVLEGDEIAEIGDDLGGNVPQLGAHVERDVREPGVDQPVTFDARYSGIWNEEITNFEWTFDGDETETGETVSRAFGTEGAQNIHLKAETDAGEIIETVEQLCVGVPADGVLKPQIFLRDQSSDGTSIVIDRIATPVNTMIWANPEHGKTRTAVVPAGVHENVVYPFDEQLTGSGNVTLVMRDQHTDERIGEAETQATITVESTGTSIDPTLVEADPDAGFQYPYFLYAPPRQENTDLMPPLVEIVNTGTATDDFEAHRSAAQRLVEGEKLQGSGRVIAHGLSAPLIVPVFPRPRTAPVDATHYVHSLDDTTMAIDSGPLERVDLQLLAMVEDAHRRLNTAGYDVGDGIMLNGFSASGNFADRFAMLHPEDVVSVTAGGLNGMVVLPVDSYDGQSLRYHIGTADLETLTGEPFDKEPFASVNRFYFMGEFDPADTLPYEDAWTDDDLRQTALDVYGLHMQADRFPRSRTVYERESIPAAFKMYRDAQHSNSQSESDIIRFHQRSVHGESGEDLRADFGENVPNSQASIRIAPERAKVGTTVAVHASGSEFYEPEREVTWDFGDGTTARGLTAKHAYSTAGTYGISVVVTGPDGRKVTSREYVTVVENLDPSQPETTKPGSNREERRDETPHPGTSESESPGFGIAGTVSALGGIGYLLKRKMKSMTERRKES